MYENYKVINLLKIWPNLSDVVNGWWKQAPFNQKLPQNRLWDGAPASDPAEELKTPRLLYDKLRAPLKPPIGSSW